MRGQKPTPLSLRPGVYQKAIWKSEQEVILSAKINGSENFELYQLQLGNSCLQSLLQHEGDILSPSLSPNNKDLLFTFKTKDLQHIYLTTLPSAKEGCL